MRDWARDGFEDAATDLLCLPRAGVQPAHCPHSAMVPAAAPLFVRDGGKRVYRYERCVQCGLSRRVCHAA